MQVLLAILIRSTLINILNDCHKTVTQAASANISEVPSKILLESLQSEPNSILDRIRSLRTIQVGAFFAVISARKIASSFTNL